MTNAEFAYGTPPQAKVLLIYYGMYSILCMFSDVWQTLVKHKTKIIEVQTKNTKTNKNKKPKTNKAKEKQTISLGGCPMTLVFFVLLVF